MSDITKITDIVDPEVLMDQVAAKFIEKVPLVNSGVVGPCPYGNLSGKAGQQITIPKFLLASSGWSAVDESTPLVTKKITTDKENGVVVRRGDAFSVMGTAQLVSMADPMAEISNQIAGVVARGLNKTLVYVLRGAMGALSDSNVYDAPATEEAAGPLIINTDRVMNARLCLGDNLEDIQFIMMYSKVFVDAAKAGMVSYVKSDIGAMTSYASMLAMLNPKMTASQRAILQNGLIPYIGNMQVLVDDGSPTGTDGNGDTTYTSYLLGAGSMWLGYQQNVTIKFDEDILSDENLLAYRVHFIPHLAGVGYKGAMNPADATLYAGASWELCEEDAKLIRAVALITH